MTSRTDVKRFPFLASGMGFEKACTFPFLDPFWERWQLPNVGYRHLPFRKQPVRLPSHSGHSASAHSRHCA
jgi:hypothetical protein